MKRTKKRIESSSPSPPAASPRPSGAAERLPADAWGEVEEELMRLGVNAFHSAVSAARKHVGPEHVLALCRYYERHRSAKWSPGVLFARTTKARPWLAECDGWPASVRPATLPPVDAHGGDVDGLSDDELRELAAGDATLRSLAGMCRSIGELRTDVAGRALLSRILARRAAATS